MNTDTITMHYIRPTPDDDMTMTLCGCRIIADYQATAEAKATGMWVSCPVCEAMALLESTGTTPEPEPEPRPDGTWIQPPLFG